jgi:hypothetical protein
VCGGRGRSCVSANYIRGAGAAFFAEALAYIGGAGAAVADTVLRSLKLNFVLRVMDGVDDFDSPPLEAELACHYRVPHVRFVVRTRVMCQAGRARAAVARGDIVAWLCERAPLWVVVHVCALLRG